jgi:hypothetical protein
VVTELRSRRSHPQQTACPACGQAISHLKYQEIAAKESARERYRSDEFQRQLEARLAAANAAAVKEKQAALSKATREAAEREVAARAEAKKEALAAMTPKIVATEKRLAELKASREADLRSQRVALEKEHDRAINADRAEAFKANQRLQKKVTSLQRQLEHKTADERGEGAEVDVFEALKAKYRNDRISRVKKGEPGADILHEVMKNGKRAGQIVYDSKNRDAWRSEYATKLRQDQMAARADHAVLSTHTFPANAQQLDIRDGVIIANPARVLAVVDILRESILQTYTLRLSRHARDEKAEELYKFMTSEHCWHLLEQIQRDSESLEALDVKEKTAHDRTWKDRGLLIRSAEKARSSLALSVERIVGTAGEETPA